MDITTISAVIASASVVMGVIIAILQLRDVAQTRHTELIIQLNPTLNGSTNELDECVSRI